MNRLIFAILCLVTTAGCDSVICAIGAPEGSDPTYCNPGGSGGGGGGDPFPDDSDSTGNPGPVKVCSATTDGLTCALGTDGGTGTCCGIVCSDMTSDGANCGACGQRCVSGEVCEQGWCGFTQCTPEVQGNACHGQKGDVQGTCCGTSCVDTADDAQNCGGCNLACGEGGACKDSECSGS